MTALELLLLLLIVSIVVVGVTVAVIIKRIFGEIRIVTDPIATVLDRLRAQELQEGNQLQHADEVLDADELLEAAVYRYRRSLTHCHECEEAALQARKRNEAWRRFDEGWRELTLACPKSGCGGRYEVSVNKETGATGSVTCLTQCEHTSEMAENPENFFSLSSHQLPTSQTGTSRQ